jgi:hypothetical protein
MSLSPVAGAILRADIAGVIEEAMGADELLIGTKIFPAYGVDARNGQYPKLEIETGRLLDPGSVKRRGPTADYARKTRQWLEDTYSCLEYGLEGLLGLDTINDLSRFFDAEATVARLTQTDLLLAHEIRVAAKTFNEDNFSAITGSTAYSAANVDVFDIGYDIDLAKEEIRKRGESTAPNRLSVVIPASLYPVIRTSKKLQQRIFGVSRSADTKPLTPQELAEAFEVREVLIGRSTYNAAKQGAAKSLTDVWSDDYIWVGQTSTGDDLMAGGAGRTIFWRQDGNLVTVESYDVPEKRALALRVRHTTDEKIINANTAQLIRTQV